MAKKYLLGLDLGTDSVGWCVTDEGNHIVRKGGKSLWGVRLFDEANDCSERRLNRGARRRVNRRKERIDLLQSIFASSMKDVDPNFFIRMNNSFYQGDDKDKAIRGDGNTLFAGIGGLTDKDFYKKYPTIYHLRAELLRNNDKADLRYLYLALHHMIKYRGNFLHEGESIDVRGGQEIVDSFAKIDAVLISLGKKPLTFNVDKIMDFRRITSGSRGLNMLKKELQVFFATEEKYVNEVVLPLIAGAKVQVGKIFDLEDDEEAGTDVKSFSVRDDSFEDILSKLNSHFEGRSEMAIIEKAKAISDFIVLNKILGDSSSISEAMVRRYERHREDLKELKAFVKKNCPAKYAECFRKHQKDLNNYAAYVGINSANGKKLERFGHCSADDFYVYLKKDIFGVTKIDDKTDPFIANIFSRMIDDDYLPRQNSSENGVFPYQLNLKEMISILERQSRYYPFIKTKDSDGLTSEEKIKSLLTYRIPYFIGPLINSKKTSQYSSFSWVVREEGKIYPWNFKEKVDFDASAAAFIKRMLNKCTYIPEADCLPKFSLLYSEYEVISFLNNVVINGKPLPFEETSGEVSKKEIIDEYFKVKAASKKSFVAFLRSKIGPSFSNDNLTYVNGGEIEKIDCSLRSYQDFSRILGADYVVKHPEVVERIILDLSVFTDRDMVVRRLRKEYGFTDEKAINAIKALPYSGFGKLSEDLLYLPSPYVDKETGEIKNITLIDAMLKTGDGLMKVLNDPSFKFGEKIAALQEEAAPKLIPGESKLPQVKEYVDDLYVSPIMKRPLLQAYEIIDEVQKIIGAPIDEYYVECARGGKPADKGKKPSRLSHLLDLYESAKKETLAIIDEGDSPDKDPEVYEEAKTRKAALSEQYKKLAVYANENRALDFRSDKLFLYFTQLGRCLYSLKPIELDSLFADQQMYDIDHIIPQAKVKDDSLANRVLVYQDKNRDKKDIYPFAPGFLAPGARAFYRYLKRIGLMEGKKYDELTRQSGNELSDDEIAQFANRQLVSTNQAVIGLIDVIKTFERRKDNSVPRIIYSKASLVSDFRQKFELLKARDANSFHHAHDAYLNIIVGRAMDSYFGYPVNKEKIDRLKKNDYSTNPDNIFNDVSEKSREAGKTRRPILDHEGNLIWKAGDSIKEIEKNIYHRFDVMVTVRQFVQPGFFNKVSIHPKTDFKDGNLFPLKKGLDPAKYGGYSDLTNGFFALLEEDCGRKGLKARLLPIPNMYAKPTDGDAIISYAHDVVGLNVNKLIIPCLRINSVIDFGTLKIEISGKNSDSDTLVKSLIQIRFSKSELATIRSISKFMDVVIKQGARGLDPLASDFDEKLKNELRIKDLMGPLVISPAANEIRNKPILITREEEDALFVTLRKKLSSKLFEGIGFSNAAKQISDESCWNAFNAASTASRAVMLDELLKMTIPDSAVLADLSILLGHSVATKRHINNYLSHCRIVVQSVTGFYVKIIWKME
jgi:CRISPR-associated endonuclease Csn1